MSACFSAPNISKWGFCEWLKALKEKEAKVVATPPCNSGGKATE